MLERTAPAIVKVLRGDCSGSGFVFEAPSLVVTSYSVVKCRGELSVLPADGRARTATVTAWSKADDLALIELDAPLAAIPLQLAKRAPVAGVPIIVFYALRDPEEPEQAPQAVAVPRFSRISRVAPTVLDLDFTADWPGSQGAVVLNSNGEVWGALCNRNRGRSQPFAVGAERLQSLLAQRGRQGGYSRELASSRFAEFFVTPLFLDRSTPGEERRNRAGVGMSSGVRIEWFFASLAEGAFYSPPRSIAYGQTESMLSLQVELMVGAEFRLSERVALSVGPGAAVSYEDIERTRVAPDGSIQSSQDQTLEGHPQVGLDLYDGGIFSRVTFQIGKGAADRLDIGFRFGS